MPRNKIFVDTSAWYAFIDKNDRDHPAAMSKVKVLDRSLLTSNYVLDEIFNKEEVDLWPR
jgi:predicted nucleic acid-binding protein